MIGPIGGVQVFHQIDAVLCHQWIQEAKCRVDMGLLVTAIVDNDVGVTKLCHDTRQEFEIILAADTDMDLLFLDLHAHRLDIDADHTHERTQIALPLLQRATFADADFEQRDVPIAKPLEVGLVNRIVMVPLVGAAVVIIEEIAV